LSSEYQPKPFTVMPCFKASASHFVWLTIFISATILGKQFLFQLYATTSFSSHLKPEHFVFFTNAFVIVMTLLSIAKILTIYTKTYSHRLVITPHHIEFIKGIASKKSTKINIAHIRTIDIEQNAADRLIDVGTIRIAASSTDGYEIEAPGINHPEKLRNFLKHRIGVLHYGEAPNPDLTY